MTDFRFDTSHLRWRNVEGGDEFTYPVGHDYTVLGHDTASGTLDMLVRFDDKGNGCQRHRHVAPTTILVLEGEHHLDELLEDGSVRHKMRRAGEYGFQDGFDVPHLERGGADGGVVFFGSHTRDGRLYELLDDDLKLIMPVTIETLVADWEANS